MRGKHRKRRCVLGIRFNLRKMIKCSFLDKQVKADQIGELSDSSLATRDYSAGSYSAPVGEGEAKTQSNNIEEEAESTLRQSNFLNYEEARALLGRLEYQKGNVEAALSVFAGIDINAVIQNIKLSLTIRCAPQRQNNQSNDAPPMSIHAVSLLFEAIFLKAKSLQALGRFEDAAQTCQVILDTVESALPEGLNGRFSTYLKLQETLSEAIELLPELWKLSGAPHQAIASYRRALLYSWNLELETQTRIQKELAIFLLYSGIEASPLKLRFQLEGAFIPKSNMEEAILLLLILLDKFLKTQIGWDPLIMDHLSFALSITGYLATLAHQLEQLPTGIMHQKEKHSKMALCYHGEGQDFVALNLLKNIFNDRENLNCANELLLASKICTDDTMFSEEGINYADKALQSLHGQCEQLTSKANCFLGILTSVKSRSVASNSKRVLIHYDTLKALQTAERLTNGKDANVIYHLCLESAEHRELDTALYYAKKLMKLEAGSSTRGWILLARILSAQKKYIDAEVIVDAAIEQTGKWDQAGLMRTKAKLQLVQGRTKNAIDTYTHLLAVLHFRKKSYGIGKKLQNRIDQDRALEVETWHDLSNIYTSVSQWQDAEVCLSKSELLSHQSTSICHSRGLLYQAKGLNKEAQKYFGEALEKEPTHVPSLISMAKILIRQQGEQSLLLARSFVRQALCLDRTNHSAWYTLGLLHKLGSLGTSVVDAAECFETAALLEEMAPVEPFR